MRFNHMVKYNGKYYTAGEEVPIEEKITKEEKAVETPPSYKKDDVTIGEKYTKTDINKMDKAELKKLASEKGVDGAQEMTGGELKKILIDMLVK